MVSLRSIRSAPTNPVEPGQVVLPLALFKGSGSGFAGYVVLFQATPVSDNKFAAEGYALTASFGYFSRVQFICELFPDVDAAICHTWGFGIIFHDVVEGREKQNGGCYGNNR
jgi:hypothetical protein